MVGGMCTSGIVLNTVLHALGPRHAVLRAASVDMMCIGRQAHSGALCGGAAAAAIGVEAAERCEEFLILHACRRLHPCLRP